MLITTFGPPSAFTQWSMYLMRIMTDVTLRDVDYFAAPTIEELRNAWASRTRQHVFYFSDCPEWAVVDVFQRAGAPALVVCEDAADITGFIVRERSMTWPWAVRLTDQCLTAIADLFDDKRTLVIHRSQRLSFETFFRAIADHFSIPLTNSDLVEILSRIDADHSLDPSMSMETPLLSKWPHARREGYGLADLATSRRPIIEAIHAPLREIVRGRTVARHLWPRELFIPGGRPEEVLDKPIDLVGPARCIVYGPYLHLPRGTWRAQMNFTVDGNVSGNQIEIDVFQNEQTDRNTFPLPTAGRFAALATFTVHDPRDAIQIRLMLKEGAIEGVLDIDDVVVERAGETGFTAVS
ncbi:MAG: hypothetical protein P4L82_07145 [Ancalomicrobiaceae bacterium]|nr:hypothetical protein [Ancalomicrobiaceae bacterium]